MVDITDLKDNYASFIDNINTFNNDELSNEIAHHAIINQCLETTKFDMASMPVVSPNALFRTLKTIFYIKRTALKLVHPELINDSDIIVTACNTTIYAIQLSNYSGFVKSVNKLIALTPEFLEKRIVYFKELHHLRSSIDSARRLPDEKYITHLYLCQYNAQQVKNSNTMPIQVKDVEYLSDVAQQISDLFINKSSSDLKHTSSAYQYYLDNLYRELGIIDTKHLTFDTITTNYYIADFLCFPFSIYNPRTLHNSTYSYLDNDIFTINLLNDICKIAPKDDPNPSYSQQIIAYNNQAKNVYADIPSFNSGIYTHINAMITNNKETDQLPYALRLNAMGLTWEEIDKESIISDDRKFISNKIHRINVLPTNTANENSSKDQASLSNPNIITPPGALLDQLSIPIDTSSQEPIDIDDILTSKSEVYNESIKELPSYQINKLQTEYLSVIAPLMPALLIAQNTTSRQKDKTSQDASSVSIDPMVSSINTYKSDFTVLETLASSPYTDTGSFSRALESCQVSLADVKANSTQVTNIQKSIESQTIELSTELAKTASAAKSGDDVSGNELSINTLATNLSNNLTSIPEPDSPIVGPYSTALNANKSIDIDNQTPYQNALSDLTLECELLDNTLNMLPSELSLEEDISPSDCLCSDILSRLQQIDSLLDYLTIPDIGDFDILPDLINLNLFTFPEIEIINKLKRLLSKIRKFNEDLANTVASHTQSAMDAVNIPPLSFGLPPLFNGLLDQITDLIPSLPDGFDLDPLNVLKFNLSNVLSINTDFLRLDKLSLDIDIPSVSPPKFGNILQLNMSLPELDLPKPDLSFLVPSIDINLPKLKGCDNFDEIKATVMSIHHKVQDIRSDVMEISQLISTYVARAHMAYNIAKGIKYTYDTAKYVKQSYDSYKRVLDEYDQKEVDDLIADTINEATTNQILQGNQTSAGGESPSNTPVTCATSQLQCSFGTGPAVYNNLIPLVTIEDKPASSIDDTLPLLNMPMFPGCQCPTNPLMNPVQFPWICVPLTSSFLPNSITTTVSGSPINTIKNKSLCQYATGGIISFTNPNQTTVFTS